MKENLNTFEEIRDYIIEEYNKIRPDKKISVEKIETADSLNYRMFPFECVSSEFQNGGRWTNFEIKVYKVGDKFIRVDEEVPATEMQEGADFEIYFAEVYPVEKTITVYE